MTTVAGLVILRVGAAIVEGAKDIFTKQWNFGKAAGHLVKGNWPVTLALAAGLGIADFVVQKKQASNLKSVVAGADVPPSPPAPAASPPSPPTSQVEAQPA
jgi:hypothetical protein